MKVNFKVQHQILAGLKYLQVVKRHGLSQKTQEMIGSYGPNTSEKPVHEKTCTELILVHVLLLVMLTCCSRRRRGSKWYACTRTLQRRVQVC